MADWMTLGASVGGALVGGLVSPLVTQRRERITARAEARRALTHVERLRWQPSDYREFMEALASFEAAAILAGLPWGVVNTYTKATTEARSAVEFVEGIGPNNENGWAITDRSLSTSHGTALERLGWALWHPWLTRFRR